MAQRIEIGQRLSGIPGDSWNEFVALANDPDFHPAPLDGRQVPDRSVLPVKVKNNTGGERQIGDVVGLVNPLFTPDEHPREIMRNARFSAVQAGEESPLWGVVLTRMGSAAAQRIPLPPGPTPGPGGTIPFPGSPSGGTGTTDDPVPVDIGMVAIMGTVWAKVNIEDPDDTLCGVGSGFVLTNGDYVGKPAKIIWQPGGVGDQSCLILLGTSLTPECETIRDIFGDPDIQPDQKYVLTFVDGNPSCRAELLQDCPDEPPNTVSLATTQFDQANASTPLIIRTDLDQTLAWNSATGTYIPLPGGGGGTAITSGSFVLDDGSSSSDGGFIFDDGDSA